MASARQLLAHLDAAGAGSSDRGVDPRPYLRDFVFEVLARLHLGIGPVRRTSTGS